MVDNLINEIKKYSELNNLDYDEVYFDVLTKGFNIVKYGFKPMINKTPNKPTTPKPKVELPKVNKPIKNNGELYD